MLHVIKESFGKDLHRHELGVLLVTQFGVPSHHAFTQPHLDETNIWDQLAMNDNWTPQRMELHEKMYKDRLEGIEKLSQAVKGKPGIKHNTWIAQRGSSGSGKTSSLVKLLGQIPKELMSFIINPDLVKAELVLSNEMLGDDLRPLATHAAFHTEGSEMMHQVSTYAKNESDHLIFEDVRLSDSLSINRLFDTAHRTKRSIILNDHHASPNVSFLTILARQVGGVDPIVPWNAFKSGFIGSAVSRIELASQLSESVISEYNLFGNMNGQQIRVASFKDGKMSIENFKMYNEIQSCANTAKREIEEFGVTVITEKVISDLLLVTPYAFRLKNTENLSMHLGKTIREVMDERSQLVGSMSQRLIF